MLHARPDYNRIQDPAHKIPDMEPVFLLRGQDKIAPDVVLVWAMIAEKLGADPKIVQHAKNHSARMKEWQAEHGSKLPDMP